MASVATFTGPAGSITLNESDRLWAARGVLGEGDESPEVEVMSCYLWAIMRRCLMGGKAWRYRNMWLAFAQSVNPEWREDGKFCRVGGKYNGSKHCEPKKLARRRRIAATDWADIPVHIRETVEAFSAGELPKPQIEAVLGTGQNRLSNWASWPGVNKAYPWGVWVGNEWFFEDRPMADGDVEITNVSTDNRPTIALVTKAGLGLVLASAIGLYLLYKG
jgi:hypothetical protein